MPRAVLIDESKTKTSYAKLFDLSKAVGVSKKEWNTLVNGLDNPLNAA